MNHVHISLYIPNQALLFTLLTFQSPWWTKNIYHNLTINIFWYHIKSSQPHTIMLPQQWKCIWRHNLLKKLSLTSEWSLYLQRSLHKQCLALCMLRTSTWKANGCCMGKILSIHFYFHSFIFFQIYSYRVKGSINCFSIYREYMQHHCYYCWQVWFGSFYFSSMYHACLLYMTSASIFIIDVSQAQEQSHQAHTDRLMQKRYNSSALAMELCLFCIKPSIHSQGFHESNQYFGQLFHPGPVAAIMACLQAGDMP